MLDHEPAQIVGANPVLAAGSALGRQSAVMDPVLDRLRGHEAIPRHLSCRESLHPGSSRFPQFPLFSLPANHVPIRRRLAAPPQRGWKHARSTTSPRRRASPFPTACHNPLERPALPRRKLPVTPDPACFASATKQAGRAPECGESGRAGHTPPRLSECRFPFCMRPDLESTCCPCRDAFGQGRSWSFRCNAVLYTGFTFPHGRQLLGDPAKCETHDAWEVFLNRQPGGRACLSGAWLDEAVAERRGWAEPRTMNPLDFQAKA